MLSACPATAVRSSEPARFFAGFHHSAFTFAHESHVHRCDIDPNQVPPGALVTYIQKGLQYLEAEANIDVSSRRGAWPNKQLHVHSKCMASSSSSPGFITPLHCHGAIELSLLCSFSLQQWLQVLQVMRQQRPWSVPCTPHACIQALQLLYCFPYADWPLRFSV